MATAEVPRPPEDGELRNIIDKLAQFVAKNGPEFEQMTKQKQKDNSKFAFLYGGEYFNYYQYKMTTEQAILKKNQQQNPGAAVTTPGSIQTTASQIQVLETQLQESEKNLKAQYDVLMQQQQAQIDLAIQKAETDKIKNLASGSLDLDDFGHVLDQLANSCTKEAIAKGKQWIFNNCQNDRLKEILLMYMVSRVRNSGSTQQFRLHVLYLINDWAHHCMRKKQDSVNQILSRYVPQLYGAACHHVKDVGGKEKLEKLMNLWESQKYFDDNSFKQLRNSAQTFASSQNALQAEYSNLTSEMIQKVQATYSQYQQQHQEFSRHVQQQINTLQTMQQFAVQNVPQQSTQPPKRRSRFDSTVPPASRQQGPAPDVQPIPEQHPQRFSGPAGYNIPPQQQPPNYPSADIGGPQHSEWRGPPPNLPYAGRPPPGPSHRMPLLASRPPWPSGPPQVWPPPRPMGPPPRGPPPGPTAVAKDDSNLIPTVPYYDLPAGLMVPLIRLEDTDYKPLDASKLRLPPPMPPSERLLAAMETFYAPPNHENPRGSEGWERLGLYEYFKEKAKAKEEAKKKEGKSRSRSSESSSSSDRSRSRSRSHSSSPTRKKRSPSRSVSRSPRRRSKSRSRSLSPPRSSHSSFGSERLNPDNKGHQLLSKMGWSGGGLGSEEQGIQEPVAGGEVRSRQDQYRGVGNVPDPYETFRQQKSGHFMQRIMSEKEKRTMAKND